MSDGRKFYCMCDSNCKYETMTKEQILAAIAQAVETGSVGDCDTGFITKVKETNSGGYVTFWVGTQAQYNALAENELNCLYIITDDTTKADILKAYENTVQVAAGAAATAGNAMKTAEDALQKASNAEEAANKYRSENFKNTVNLSWVASSGGQNLSFLEATPVRYEYNPLTGLVHFAFNIWFKGMLHEGEIIELVHYGNLYLPAKNSPNAPIAADSAAVTAYYSRGDDTRIFIKVNKDIDTGDTDGRLINFSGWYFYGEDTAVG